MLPKCIQGKSWYVFKAQPVDIGLSDHKVVKSRVFISKPQPEIILQNWNTKEIDTTLLAKELSDIQPQDGNPDEMAEYYNSKLSEIFDIHAPLREKRVVVQPNTSWYNASIQHQKVLKRRLERKWKKSRLPEDYKNFRVQCEVVNRCICECKSEFLSNQIIKTKGDTFSGNQTFTG